MFSWKYNCERNNKGGNIEEMLGFNPCFHGSTTVSKAGDRQYFNKI
ncbi:Uncharacterized protein dnl_30360 [Desulfonema limicola]|uniref:Uncharacterized protein n=1 Tax=Desulfonema limicola TaxID=45656 RepID=A0A975B8J4_9BACT|nr:Uncharacterized protein dnl_30360 [Desulfonema limicola]